MTPDEYQRREDALVARMMFMERFIAPISRGYSLRVTRDGEPGALVVIVGWTDDDITRLFSNWPAGASVRPKRSS